jgi:hypothetical protein
VSRLLCQRQWRGDSELVLVPNELVRGVRQRWLEALARTQNNTYSLSARTALSLVADEYARQQWTLRGEPLSLSVESTRSPPCVWKLSTETTTSATRFDWQAFGFVKRAQ